MRYLLVLTLLLTGCSKSNEIGCKIESSINSAGAMGISVGLGCDGVEAIKADIGKVTAKLKMCDKDSKNRKVLNLCEALAAEVVDLALSNGVPATWQCKGSPTTAAVRNLLKEGCEKVM